MLIARQIIASAQRKASIDKMSSSGEFAPVRSLENGLTASQLQADFTSFTIQLKLVAKQFENLQGPKDTKPKNRFNPNYARLINKHLTMKSLNNIKTLSKKIAQYKEDFECLGHLTANHCDEHLILSNDNCVLQKSLESYKVHNLYFCLLDHLGPRSWNQCQFSTKPVKRW